MIESHEFLKSVLDTITEHIVVIDQAGNIKFVNKSWIAFGNDNGLTNTVWEDFNYLKACDKSAVISDKDGLRASTGIRKVINSEQQLFYFEYPCHSPNEKRWFMMRTTTFNLKRTPYYVISHQNITERKLAEEKVSNLSRMDGLTGIPNRRYFDEFLDNEWRRCDRVKNPISLAIIDLDHFKLLNDTYGHQAGDECLMRVGKVLEKFNRRPSDICARYGGEEFSVVLGNTDIKESLVIINKLHVALSDLKIPNENSPIKPILTASIGLATMYPKNQTKNEKDLIKAADMMLYSAKNNGRNQILFKCE